MAEQTQSKVLWTLRNPYLWAMGLAVSYSALLLALPSGIGAFEIPNAQDLRDDVRGELCERFGARVCDDGAETDEGTGTGDGTDTGGSGGTGGGTSRDQVSMTIRTSDAVVTTDTLTLPRATAGDVRVTPTDGGSTVLVDARSVLAQLVAFDMESDEFAITDLQYYPAYESFFLNCITLAKGSEQCGQWQYAVNGEYPAVGLDKQILAGGDRVHLFFGSPRTVVSPRTVRPNEAFTVVVQEYDTKVGAYKPIGDYTVGVVQDNPADAWAPFEIATKTVNTKGEAMFTIATTGEYKIGIKEDSYYPTVPLTVSAGMSGGGGGAILRDDGPFDVPSARSFISGMQNADGSFSAPMYTDWAVIALVASGADTTKVRAYLMKDVAVLSSVTDYERRAMALMALGVSPYDGTSVNYIDAILARYGGLQIGDPALVNDDIFGLVVLTQAGYGVTDEVVQHVVAYLVHEQKANGSWEGSVDLTAAGIQALVPYRKVCG